MNKALNWLILLMLTSMILQIAVIPIHIARADEPAMWASYVVDYYQGARKDGSPVLAERSDPNDVLGPPDSGVSGPPVLFFSLGFGGWIIVGFPDPIANEPGDDVLVIETTWGSYPLESADVYVSEDGENWIFAGAVDNTDKQGEVEFPNDLTCINYVKIVDTTPPGVHQAEADGYDLDAVGAYNICMSIEVSVDIKPCSWPNPINIASKGSFSVAICGTEDFDVMSIDPETVRITFEGLEECISPLRWSYEDVATPYAGEPGGGHDLCGDGYMDLVLHFDTQEAVNTLGLHLYLGNTIPMTIMANLHEMYNGTPIIGQDYARILGPKWKVMKCV